MGQSVYKHRHMLGLHLPRKVVGILALWLGAFSTLCLPATLLAEETGAEIIISVPDQRMNVIRDGATIATFPVSTSRFGLGDAPRSYRTPLGHFRISGKIGTNLPEGAVLKGRRFTGEVLKVNAPGRDPIVTRILQLEGLEAHNRRAQQRGIYIHGTPEERNLGRPVSFGCIRMRSQDVVALYRQVDVGTRVLISAQSSRAVLNALARNGGSLARYATLAAASTQEKKSASRLASAKLSPTRLASAGGTAAKEEEARSPFSLAWKF